MIVMADEMIHWVKEFMRGEVVDDETLALDWIDQVGPGGDFLALDHTRPHFRKNHDNWAAEGRLDLRDCARHKIKMILADHQPDPLEKDITEAIQGVINRAIQSKL
jgi:trimethylamine--corrinoid protein Co-methyltransferase